MKISRLLAVLLLAACLISCNPLPPGEDTDTSAVTDAPVESFELIGNAVFENGSLSAKRGATSYAFFGPDMEKEFSVSCDITLNGAGLAGFLLCAVDENNCIMLSLDYSGQAVVLQRLRNGVPEQLGRRKCKVELGKAVQMKAECVGGVLKLYYNENPLDEDPYPKFEIYVNAESGKRAGFRIGNGIASFDNIVLEAPEKTEEIKTYTNPIITGCDPDVMYYEGVYYLYQRINDGNNVFQVSTSTDLVHWKRGNIIYVHDPKYETRTYMSPNVFHYNGKFYLLFAAKIADGTNRLFYATCDTPDGVFVHGDTQKRLHDDVSEIGGHPHLIDGKLYFTFVRFGGGNHIWIEEFTVTEDDTFVPVKDTLTLLISPTDSYEIDEFGNIAEGGIIMKHNGYYYMIYASGHYLGHYGQAYAISENILGPYTKYEYNDILTFTLNIDGCGAAVYVPSPDGTELFLIYHCHAAVGTVEPRLTCIDRIKFVPDPDGGPDIMCVYGPTVTPQPLPSANSK